MIKNTQRFSDRVGNYVKYRPDYPRTIVRFFEKDLELKLTSRMADIGSGTGKLTSIFLDAGYAVDGVEPNDEMRAAGEQLVGHHHMFRSFKGTAEDTTLPSTSYDFVIAGQAFHWFDPVLSKKEFQRILKPGGWVVLIWNERNIYSPFLRDYEYFVQQYSTDYDTVMHRNISDQILSSFFDSRGFAMKTTDNYQLFDLPSLKGRYLSSSYGLNEGHPDHLEAMYKLENLFDKHQEEGKVRMNYLTKIYFGHVEK